MHDEGESRPLLRREVLRRGAAVALAGAALPFSGSGESASGESASAEAGVDTAPRVRRYVPLGRTGLRISDISFGSSRTTDPDLVRHAFDLGVSYFDTAESYRGGRSEEAIGAALQGKRDRVVIASKVQAEATSSRDALLRALEGSLRRLRTDYLDIYFNHAVNDIDRLENSEWPEFVDRARTQGKLRFTGMSGHGGRLVECLDRALDRDLFDVLLVAYNFGQDPSFYENFTRSFDFVATQPDLPRVLAKAKGKGVGTIAMKTLMGARLNDMRPWERGGTFAQAALRWALSNADLDALVISMTSRERIDEFLVASGADSVRRSDARLLERYAALQSTAYCRHGCDVCAESCPDGVPIAEVLRTRMYATDYRDPALARDDYARLGEGAAACLTCAHRSCLGACPYGLPIAELTRSAHALLADS